MSFQLITVWYNEEYLAPYFLNHYSWVDKIHILLDSDTNDKTVEIANSYSNVNIEYITFPDMMDDIIKARKINEKYNKITQPDYVIVVDSDEFILCNNLKSSVRTHVENYNKNLFFAPLWQVYQNEHDLTLDASLPAYSQRLHGDPAIVNCYVKPVIARTGLDLLWGYGNHSVVFNGVHMGWNTRNLQEMKAHGVTTQAIEMLQGAHWRLFDLDETIRRRIQNRTRRQSLFNLKSNLTYHHHKTTLDDIMTEYNNFKNSPIVIKNRNYRADESINCSSMFESLVTESDIVDRYDINKYSSDDLIHITADSELPEWYEHVIPLSADESLAENLFVLACNYVRSGNVSKAVYVLKKALDISPQNLHYRVYLKDWINLLA